MELSGTNVLGKRAQTHTKGGANMYINVKIEMVRNHITQQSLADEMGIHRNSLVKKINGLLGWKASELALMSQKFNKSIRYLTTKEGKQ